MSKSQWLDFPTMLRGILRNLGEICDWCRPEVPRSTWDGEVYVELLADMMKAHVRKWFIEYELPYRSLALDPEYVAKFVHKG